MGFIRERKLKNGGTRYQAEIRLKGHPMLTAAFDRKTDAKAWIYKIEADIRCGRQQLYAEGKRRTLAEKRLRYFVGVTTLLGKKGELIRHLFDKRGIEFPPIHKGREGGFPASQSTASLAFKILIST